MSLALLFAGQGVQHPAMLPWLDDAPAAAPVLARMGQAIGSDWRQRLTNPDWAESNRVAQCLITGTALGAWHALQALGLPEPMAVAGYSVGELAAFSVAGVYDDGTALSLAEARAAAMDAATAGHHGGLISVAGPNAEAIAAVCARWSLQLAIRIAPDRCLLGGDDGALVAAAAALSAQGIETTRLRVRVASHTPQLQPAADAFAAFIAPLAWREPTRVLVCNREGGAARRTDELKRCLAEQIATTVQWQDCMNTLAERRPRCVLEVGAGNSLSKLWLAAHPDIPSRSIDEFANPARAVAWVASRLRS